jgi:hemolysin D
LTADEAEFLPAALSLQAMPVSPAGRLVGRILMLLVVAVLVWAVLGKVDIVVTATGKVVPSGHTKAIASVEVGSVRALHVREGQSVKAGDVLVELDARAADSERDKARADALAAALQAARSRALIAAIDDGRAPALAAVPEVPRERWLEAQQHLHGQWLDYLAKRGRLEGEIQHALSALPLAAERARDYAALAETNDVSRHAYLEKEQARVDLEGQLAEARNQERALAAETRKTAQDTLADAERVLSDASLDAVRAGAHSDLLKLVAPVDGTVQQLTVHTIGGVVPAAQALMQVVPAQSTVEVEAFMENRDVGFVREGQAAAVEVDTFNYAKYGTVPARVTHVSRDAIEDEKRGLMYSIRVALDRASIRTENGLARLTPGMSVTVQIKTGSRRVIEYVLSPLLQHVRESLHER